MRLRAIFPLFILAVFFIVPHIAHATIPFFGPILPEGPEGTCPASFGLLIDVINNIIQLAITLLIVFLAPIMIAWAGFLYVMSPTNPGNRSQANKLLLNTVIGIVVAMCAWLIVDAVMAVFYSPAAFGAAWSDLVTGKGVAKCLDVPTAFKQATGGGAGGGGGTGGGGASDPTADGHFDYQSGISAQAGTASNALNLLLGCMAGKVPGNVGQISSISDSLIVSGSKTFAECATGGCQHAAHSCHYGGQFCIGKSYAVDFGDEWNYTVLSSAAKSCTNNQAYVGYEGNHVHVSIGNMAGCGCN